VNAASSSPIIHAAFVMQVCLAAIMAFGAFSADRDERFSSDYINPLLVGRKGWITVVFFLVTIVVLVSSDAFLDNWKGLAGTIRIGSLHWQFALFCVFLADIVWTFVLVYLTAGSERSAFSAIYFVLPAFAFFLKQDSHRILSYAAAIVVCFTAGLYWIKENSKPPNRSTGWWISMSCLGLSLILGFMTR